MNKIPTLNRSLSILILLIIAISVISIGFIIFLLCICAIFVPLTYLFGLITNQSYNRVCDNSEVIYQLNRFGRISLILLITIFLIITFI